MMEVIKRNDAETFLTELAGYTEYDSCRAKASFPWGKVAYDEGRLPATSRVDSSRSTTISPIGIAEVAAGDGALHM